MCVCSLYAVLLPTTLYVGIVLGPSSSLEPVYVDLVAFFVLVHVSAITFTLWSVNFILLDCFLGGWARETRRTPTLVLPVGLICLKSNILNFNYKYFFRLSLKIHLEM